MEDENCETVRLDESSDLPNELSEQTEMTEIGLSSSLEEQFAADIESMSFDDLVAEQERLDALSQMDDLDIFAEYDESQRNEYTEELLMPNSDELGEMTQSSDAEQIKDETSIQEIEESSQEVLEAVQSERERLLGFRDELIEMQSRETEESEGDFDGDSPLALTRDITSETLGSRENDTEEILENYRDNLRGYGVKEARV